MSTTKKPTRNVTAADLEPLTKIVIHAIWEDHVRSHDHVIEAAERVLEPLILAALAMRNSYPLSQDGRDMWDEAIKAIRNAS